VADTGAAAEGKGPLARLLVRDAAAAVSVLGATATQRLLGPRCPPWCEQRRLTTSEGLGLADALERPA